MSSTVITHRASYRFDLAPDQLWDRIGEVDNFESWWPWLTGFHIDGHGLSTGSVLHGVVTPPLPYRMRIEVSLVDCQRPRSIVATVGGDLIGHARLQLRSADGGVWADVEWTVEMRQPAMRMASRFARPVLQWGHDRVVEMTVAGFRHRIERP